MKSTRHTHLRLLAAIFVSLVLIYIWLVTPGADNNHLRPIKMGRCAPVAPYPEMVLVQGGTFTMGALTERPEEGPPTDKPVTNFWISSTEITNAQFEVFVAATGYKTLAERGRKSDDDLAPPQHNAPGSAVFTPPTIPVDNNPTRMWWRFVPGANWRHPEGPNSDIKSRKNHPVVHIAYEDAQSYAHWLGHTLPTEEQFEYAARGTLENTRFAWGDQFSPQGKHMANTWQGIFPFNNTGKDGYLATAPVGCFPANAYGAYDLIGNVWEWTSRPYYPSHHGNTPTPANGYDPRQPGISVKVIKGGSFLCAPNYCARYRPAARQAQDVGLGTSHIGFRTVSNQPPAGARQAHARATEKTRFNLNSSVEL